MAVCPPKVPVLPLPYLASFSPLLPLPSLTLLTQTLYQRAQPSLSHLWPGSPLHDRPRGSGGACASPAPRLHDNPLVAGIELSHPPPAPFSSPRLRGSFRQARDRLGGPGTIETARCSPRRALGGALCSRLRRKASPASLSEGLDVPKRPALSPQTADVSMVASPSLAAILQGGTLNLERLEQGFEAEL